MAPSGGMMATPKTHRNRWIELRPHSGSAGVLKRTPDSHTPIEFCGSYTEPRYASYEFSDRDFEVICHDKPTENLQKLLDLGYKEGSACRILDTLGLE